MQQFRFKSLNSATCGGGAGGGCPLPGHRPGRSFSPSTPPPLLSVPRGPAPPPPDSPPGAAAAGHVSGIQCTSPKRRRRLPRSPPPGPPHTHTHPRPKRGGAGGQAAPHTHTPLRCLREAPCSSPPPPGRGGGGLGERPPVLWGCLGGGAALCMCVSPLLPLPPPPWKRQGWPWKRRVCNVGIKNLRTRRQHKLGRLRPPAPPVQPFLRGKHPAGGDVLLVKVTRGRFWDQMGAPRRLPAPKFVLSA